MRIIKRAVRRLVQAAGYDFTKYRPDLSEKAQLARLLKVYSVNLVFDVGANCGEYGVQLRDGGYSGRIISYEPSSDAYQALCTASARDKQWIVPARVALGASSGHVKLNI